MFSSCTTIMKIRFSRSAAVALVVIASATSSIHGFAQGRVSTSAVFYGERRINDGLPVRTTLCSAGVGQSGSIAAGCTFVDNPVWGSFKDTLNVTVSSSKERGPEIRTLSAGAGRFTQSVNLQEFVYYSDIAASIKDTLFLARGEGADFFRFALRLTGNIAVDPQRCLPVGGCLPPSVADPFQRLISSARFTTALGSCAVSGLGRREENFTGLVDNLLICDVASRAVINGRLGFEIGFDQLLGFERNIGQGATSEYAYLLDFMNTMKIEKVQAFDSQSNDISGRYGFSYVGLPSQSVVPEPASFALLASGLGILGVTARARRRRRTP